MAKSFSLVKYGLIFPCIYIYSTMVYVSKTMSHPNTSNRSLHEKEKAGRFVVAFDPLDGSSNIDCNVSTGASRVACHVSRRFYERGVVGSWDYGFL
jgi:hypothetical protein